MGDPYKPKRSRSVAEVGDQKAAVRERLVRLGATDEDLAGFDEHWPPPQEVLDWFLSGTDDELRAEIVRTQDEYDYATRTEREQAAIDVDADVVAKLAGTVPEVQEWLDEDPYPPQRAHAALTLETSSQGSDRKGVKDYARGIIEAHAPAA